MCWRRSNRTTTRKCRGTTHVFETQKTFMRAGTSLLQPSFPGSRHSGSGDSAGQLARVTHQPARLWGRYLTRAFPGQHPLSSVGLLPADLGSGCHRPVGARCLPPYPRFTACKARGGVARGEPLVARGQPEAAVFPSPQGCVLVPLRDPGSVARAKRGWVAGGPWMWVSGRMLPPSSRAAPGPGRRRLPSFWWV